MTTRILLIRLSSLGDIVISLAAIAALRRTLDDVEIHWLVEDRFRALVDEVVGVDRVLSFPRRHPSRLVAHAAALRDSRYDWAIDLQGNLKSAAHLRVARAARRVGLGRGHAREGAHLAAEIGVAPRRGCHRLERVLALVAPLGVRPPASMDGCGVSSISDPPFAPDLRPDLRRHPEIEDELDQRLPPAEVDDRVVIHPGTSAFGAFKRLPPTTFGRVIAELRSRGRRVFVTHGPGEEALAAEVVGAAGPDVEVLPPRHGLRGLIALSRRAGVFVAADSGPLLLASAVGAPTVALFGPKDPAVYAPPFSPTSVVRNSVPCSPCSLRRCPDPICMTEMTAESIVAAVEQRLRERHADRLTAGR